MTASVSIASLVRDGRLLPVARTIPSVVEENAAREALCFARFRLFPTARVLLRDEAPVEIGSRAFDLLCLLLRTQGRVVERADIFREVWPTTIVDESNLRFQVSRLRTVLGEDRHLLKTVPGRGYMLATERRTQGQELGPEDDGLEWALSAPASSVDRDQALERLGELLGVLLEEIRALRRPAGDLSPSGGRRPSRRALAQALGQGLGLS